jgi:arginyl-tRNA synthetase
MRNLVEEAKHQIEGLVNAAIIAASAKGKLPIGVRIKYSTEAAKKPGFGDFASSCYVSTADNKKNTPQEIAKAICGELVLEDSYFLSAEAADKGYINFRLSDRWYSAVLEDIEAENNEYGFAAADNGGNTLLASMFGEDSSLSLNQLRAGVLSDMLAAMLKRAGFHVCIEHIYTGSGALNEPSAVLERYGVKCDSRINVSDETAYFRHILTERGFNRAVIITEAGRKGSVQSIKENLSAFGIVKDMLEAVYAAPVSICRSGRPFDTDVFNGGAHALLETLPPYAVRYFFCSKPDIPLLFDTDLAQRIDGGNPSYYITYAGKRLRSLISSLKAEVRNIPAANKAEITLLNAGAERELIKYLACFPEEVRLAVQNLDPSRISRYLTGLITLYYKVINTCKIKCTESGLLGARLKLLESVRCVLENGLSLLGIS